LRLAFRLASPLSALVHHAGALMNPVRLARRLDNAAGSAGAVSWPSSTANVLDLTLRFGSRSTAL